MRLIVAKVVLLFDMEIVDKTLDWNAQECFTLWDRPALMVNVKPVGSENRSS